jgi:hypothetical protein
VALSPITFLGQEILAMLPLSLPIWLGGLWYLFFDKEGKRFRLLGWAWLVTAAIIMTLSPRIYYLFPAYPVLFAAGSVAWERWLAGGGRSLGLRATGLAPSASGLRALRDVSRYRAHASRALALRVIKPAYVALMVLMAALSAPTVIPLLTPETYVHYAAAIHLEQPRIENHRLGPLPQLFADQFGWDEMAEAVAGAYNNLPPDVRTRTAILGQNYGQAGAIDLFGPKYGIPEGTAISSHQNYFLWGPHDYTGDSMIVMNDRPERLAEIFTTFRKVAEVSNAYSMPYQHFDVYYCEGMKQPLSTLWPELKKWD